MNNKMNITLLISSQKTSRIYMNVLKEYLQKEIPDAHLTYFISQHDSNNSPRRKSSIIESRYLGQEECILLGLDGFLPPDMLNNISGKKILIYLPEIGVPKDKKKYLIGYNYLITFDERMDAYFADECNKQNVKLLSGVENIFAEELQCKSNILSAKEELYEKYPQLKKKKILSLITRGTCMRHYLEKYKMLDVKRILQQLPDDIVFMTNCRQIQLASSRIPYEYTNKYIGFSQNDLINVIYASNWMLSNMAITEQCAGGQRPLMYNGNEYEKEIQKKHQGVCVIPDESFVDSILDTIKLNYKSIRPLDKCKRSRSFSEILKNICV